MDYRVADILGAQPSSVQDENWDGMHRLSYADGYTELVRRVALMQTGATLRLSVPDFAFAVSGYQQRTGALPMLLSVSSPEDSASAAWYDESALAEAMRQAGLVDIRRWMRKGQTLCLAGTKPAIPASVDSEMSIAAVLSLPRLGFNTFWAAALEALAPLGIPLMDARSAFWEQGMQRAIGKTLDERKPDAVLCLDYDTPPHAGAIKALRRVMQEHPEIDAVVPLQSSRHGDKCLFSIDLPPGVESLDAIPASVFAYPLTPITRAHFGCTLIRASAFAKLPKPWFKTIADPNGDFEEGRIDADVYFWKQFIECGLKPVLANRVRIGHVVEMVKVPGPDFGPIYLTPEEYRASVGHAVD